VNSTDKATDLLEICFGWFVFGCVVVIAGSLVALSASLVVKQIMEVFE